MEASTISIIAQGGTAGLITFLLCALVAVLKGWWVPGYLYRDLVTKLARYEELAFKAMTLAERAATKDGAT